MSFTDRTYTSSFIRTKSNRKANRKYKKRHYLDKVMNIVRNSEPINNLFATDFDFINNVQLEHHSEVRAQTLRTPDLFEQKSDYSSTEQSWPTLNTPSVVLVEEANKDEPSGSGQLTLSDILEGKQVSFEPLNLTQPESENYEVSSDQPNGQVEANIETSERSSAEYFTLEQLKEAALSIPGIAALSGDLVCKTPAYSNRECEFNLSASISGEIVRVDGFASDYILAEKKALVRLCETYNAKHELARLTRNPRHILNRFQDITTKSENRSSGSGQCIPSTSPTYSTKPANFHYSSDASYLYDYGHWETGQPALPQLMPNAHLRTYQ